eukprot:GFYU01003129.1.p1 GENE.GFYU01003129.1~~GFYU01003129.1.p1  ORF type:complete len:168 (+),score=23.54 GFYU01003129.1:72-506(+)
MAIPVNTMKTTTACDFCHTVAYCGETSHNHTSKKFCSTTCRQSFERSHYASFSTVCINCRIQEPLQEYGDRYCCGECKWSHQFRVKKQLQDATRRRREAAKNQPSNVVKARTLRPLLRRESSGGWDTAVNQIGDAMETMFDFEI